MTNRRFSKLIGILAVICCISASVITSTGFTSYASTVTATFSGMTLSTDGSASWNLDSTLGMQVVDKYELKLARKSGGNWNTGYKTVKTSENSYDFSFSSTGQYYYVVRAVYIGGDVSTWSSPSPTVSVTSDDISHGGGSISENTGIAYIPVTGANGVVYYVQAGPGTGYVSGTSTIGPGGNYTRTAANNNLVNGNTIVNVQGGPGVIGTNSPGAAAITGNNSNSGWVREGNGWRYKYANNTYANNSWDYINGKWYYFNPNGYMATGWVYYNNNWYLCGTDGERKTGWNMVNNNWYYLNEGGIMQTGYVVVDGITYYTDHNGARFSGGYNPDGHYFDESGVMIK